MTAAIINQTDLALANATAGWDVFPCLPEPDGEREAKSPLVDWPRVATSDPELVSKWWRIWPNALVGLRIPEGVTVVDIDHHEGRDGFELAESNGWPTEAAVMGTSTSGLGRHLWYSGRSRNVPVVPQYIDRKTHGGYVVASYPVPDRATIVEPLPQPYTLDEVAPVIVNPDALSWLSDGTPSGYVQNWIDALPEALTGDDSVTRYTSELSSMTYAGMSGTRAAFDALQRAWDNGEHSSPNPDWPGRSLARMLTADRPFWLDGDTLEDLADAMADVGPMLRFVSLDELALRPRPKSLIDGYVQAGRMMMLVGEPGVGKSFVALSWSASIACGLPFFGHHSRQGTVLYVGAEGADAFSERMAAWERANGQSIPRDRLLFADQSMSLTDAESVELTVAAVKHYGASLVVLDTFSQLSGVDDENNAAMVARALSAAQSIRDAGNGDTAVLLVHHTTKSGSSYRGSTALLGNVDSMMMMTGSSASFTLSNRASEGGKLKDGTPIRETGFAIEASKGGSAHVARSGTDLIRDAVLEVLEDGEWHPRSDFGNPGGNSDSSVKRRVRELVEQDVLRQQGNGPSTVYALASKQVF